MNGIVTTPDVKLFVAAVREHLADLSEEEREELVGGLDADLSDWVSERGVESLPEPAAYAAELRAAAGFSPEAPARRTTSRRDGLMAWMDRGAATWTRWVDTRDHLRLPVLATSLRPVWWAVRGLCAAGLVCEIWGAQGTFGFTSSRALLAVVAVLGSVLLGLWWPTSPARRSLLLRLALVALNVCAVAMVPVAYGRFFESHSWEFDSAYSASTPADAGGLAFDGEPVANIYAYDAQGQPLTGVQLVDRQGRRLSITRDPYGEGTGWGEFALVPWLNGRTPLFSVFPLAERTVDPETGDPVGDAHIQTPPFASLPPVTLAGTTPSVLAPSPAPKPADSRPSTVR